MTIKQSPPGFVNVGGPLIQKIQSQLNSLGFDAGAVDGVWGQRTVNGIKNWQQSKQLQDDGIIDDNAWTTLIQGSVPPLFERSLQLTGAWEGTGYSGANGNFDGQGITWGVVGFTWGNGELQGILREIKSLFPAVFSAAFGPLESAIINVLSDSLPAQMALARSISTNGGNNIEPQWAACFKALGNDPNVQAIENAHAQHYWTAGTGLAQQFGLASDRGLALCFDIAVQNTVTHSMMDEIQQQTHGLAETDKLPIIAHVVAEHSNPRFFNDVLKRKMTFVVGQGTVHSDRYDISCWGIG
jgi:Putative peptidoglycan binding domain/Glycosyl hydrolase family 46